METPLLSSVRPYARALIRRKARALARSPGFSPSDQDDIEQELWLSLWRQSKRFDPARGSAVHFARLVVSSTTTMLFRSRWRQKRAVAPLSLDRAVVESEGVSIPMTAVVTYADLRRRSHCR